MYAVIKTGGKQYRVQEGDVISIEKLNANVGDKVEFDEVLLVGGKKLEVGTPFIEGYKVFGEVLENGKQKKVIIYKYKAKKDYQKKNGHRQPYTMVEITGLGESKTAAKPAAKKEKAVEAVKETSEVSVSMSMKKDELLALAETKGVSVDSKATKTEIIEAIEASAK
ncbi:MAG: 50S ribosomal protein L21 [Peptostreptococcaceae bacterium]|nr:50S ribosomal protein L21 [Peptostreptococcaceae bacterium]